MKETLSKHSNVSSEPLLLLLSTPSSSPHERGAGCHFCTLFFFGVSWRSGVKATVNSCQDLLLMDQTDGRG